MKENTQNQILPENPTPLNGKIARVSDTGNNNNIENSNCHANEVKETGTASQTSISIDDLEKLIRQNLSLNSLNLELKTKIANLELSEETFYQNNKKTKYFTGLDNYETLMFLSKLVTPHLVTNNPAISPFNQFLLTLMKLRLNFPLNYLAYRY